MKRRVLWVGDAVAATGFARATHHTLEAFRADWDIHVLGLNYGGDPHRYPYDIYPCGPGGDPYGLGRTAKLVTRLRPDVVIVQNDPWNVPEYVKRIGNVPTVAAIAVDGKNMAAARKLNGLAGAIFWTEFGLQEARLGGYAGPAAVVPLGVDLDVYHQVDQQFARHELGLPPVLKDAFVAGNVNRNQPRKRLDLTVEYFADWVRSRDVRDAYLFLHVAPTGDQGYDLSQLMEYYRLSNRLILAEPDIGHGVPESRLSLAYSAFDVQVSTSQGEGFGLTTAEGMACGVPQIVPDWSALGEWATAADRIRCSAQVVTPNYINVVGGIPDKAEFVEALDRLYRDPLARAERRAAGLALVAEERFRWPVIAGRFREAVEAFLGPVTLSRPAAPVETVEAVR